jgi:hypothetical protein
MAILVGPALPLGLVRVRVLGFRMIYILVYLSLVLLSALLWKTAPRRRPVPHSPPPLRFDAIDAPRPPTVIGASAAWRASGHTEPAWGARVGSSATGYVVVIAAIAVMLDLSLAGVGPAPVELAAPEVSVAWGSETAPPDSFDLQAFFADWSGPQDLGGGYGPASRAFLHTADEAPFRFDALVSHAMAPTGLEGDHGWIFA